MIDYEYIEPGIHRYYNRYRAYADGTQKYFSTTTEARAWRTKILTDKRKAHRGRSYVHVHKRKDARCKDLPIGLCERSYKRPRRNGGYQHYQAIRGYIWLDGVTICAIERAFGARRTREEAIEQVLREREKLEEELIYGSI